MSDQNELIAQFVQVSGTDEDVARFYLSSSNWSLEDALNTFLGYPNEDSRASGTDSQVPTSSTGSASTASGPTQRTEGATFSSTAKPKFATLGDMSKQSSTDDEEQEAFYAGGSDRSGQQVLGPPKRKNFKDQLTDMFRMAQESNITEPGPSTSRGGGGGSGGGGVGGGEAWGQGVRLGMTDTDHTVVGAPRQSANQSNKKPAVVLKLWSQGFSIDDGELRQYDDKENKEFLSTVMRGEIPQELLDMGRMVNVDVEDHRHEDYKNKPSQPTFKGSGQALGSPVPNVAAGAAATVTTPATSAAAAATNDVTDVNAINEAAARETLNLNTSAPTTTLQIRLADGSRLTAQFNLSHTVSDIRRYIQNARPQYLDSNFTLVSSFPTRELSDDNSTIEMAGLKNAALMQRIK